MHSQLSRKVVKDDTTRIIKIAIRCGVCGQTKVEKSLRVVVF